MNKKLLVIISCIVLSVPFINCKKTLATDIIKIASFNLQIFGVTKAGKPEVMEILANIISEFDIIALQEIRDASGTAIQDLEAQVDSLGVNHDYIIGPRVGASTSKEQYAYMYRVDTINKGSSYTYVDSDIDVNGNGVVDEEDGDTKGLFSREPFIAEFTAKNGNFDFVLITCHTVPDEAPQEIDSLITVLEDAQNHYTDENDFIILGDLNADCTYFTEAEKEASLLRDEKYIWLITDDMDTTVSPSTSCAYDRIIILSPSIEDYANESNVFLFDQIYDLTQEEAEDVSDHYPVWSSFYSDHDTDNIDEFPWELFYPAFIKKK